MDSFDEWTRFYWILKCYEAVQGRKCPEHCRKTLCLQLAHSGEKTDGVFALCFPTIMDDLKNRPWECPLCDDSHVWHNIYAWPNDHLWACPGFLKFKHPNLNQFQCNGIAEVRAFERDRTIPPTKPTSHSATIDVGDHDIALAEEKTKSEARVPNVRSITTPLCVRYTRTSSRTARKWKPYLHTRQRRFKTKRIRTETIPLTMEGTGLLDFTDEK